MDNSGRRFRNLGMRLFESLVSLYPPRFRGEFSIEIQAIILSRMCEADGHGKAAWFAAAFQEITGLIVSILRERWHEHRIRKEKATVPKDALQKEAGAEIGGVQFLRPVGASGALWFTGWTLLTTAAIPAALIAAPVLAALFVGLINLGVAAGFWPSAKMFPAEASGFLISLALTLSLAQWYLLRNFLPRARLWFLATGAGILLGGLVTGLILLGSWAQNWDPIWIMPAVLLPGGLALGMAQWLYLRRFLPNAFWIIFIDVLAAGSILVAGGTFNLAELAVFLLPGAITGLGLLLLLRQAQPQMPHQVQTEARRENDRRLPRLARVGIGVVALVPLFFVCSWVYAASQLALAKNAGVYPTVEEAIIGNNSQGWGDAEVVRIEDVRAGPNRGGGVQPHVWFGSATIYLDKAPQGYDQDHDHYMSGSYYIHVKEGWVFVGEGAFPEFIGWVMELYNMEGVKR